MRCLVADGRSISYSIVTGTLGYDKLHECIINDPAHSWPSQSDGKRARGGQKRRGGGARSVTGVDESHPSRVPVSKPDEGRLLLLPADCTSGVAATTAQSDCYTYETRPPLERIPFQLTEVREVVEPMSVPPVCVCVLSHASRPFQRSASSHVSTSALRAHCLGHGRGDWKEGWRCAAANSHSAVMGDPSIGMATCSLFFPMGTCWAPTTHVGGAAPTD
jgi:hypothetical protein